MLNFSLFENMLTERKNDFSAQTFPAICYTRDQIIDLMLRRGTLITKTDVMAVLNNLEEVVAEITSDGCTINMPLFNTSFSISGVFEGSMDNFDGSRHKLNVNLSKGTLLRDAEKNVKLTKITSAAPAPNILEAKDAVSDTVNDQLTPGGVITLWGNNLKIAGDNPDVGLWFVHETGNAVKATVIVSNKPASIIAMIPASLVPGNYTLRVNTQYNGTSRMWVAPRVSMYDRVLVVS